MQKKRKFNKIEYCSQTRQRNISKKKGNQQQTASLNINLKTINKNYLHEFLEGEGPNEDQRVIINEYIRKDKANFKSTRKLFGVLDLDQQSHQFEAYEHIRQYMLERYTSTKFLKRVFQNEKMDFKSKLIFIKFLEKIRLSALSPAQHSFWKERY